MITTNKVYCIDCREGLAQLKQQDLKVNLIVDSPPYWKQRKYEAEDIIWNGQENCDHERKKDGSCSKCQSWKGQLGLEPLAKSYITHLVEIYDSAREVLRKDGSLWVNISDTSATQGGQNRDTDVDYSQYSTINISHKMIGTPLIKSKEFPRKSYCGIPERFLAEMIDRGWICRGKIIWVKVDSMPSSSYDSFTNNWEYFFWFVKTRYL